MIVKITDKKTVSIQLKNCETLYHKIVSESNIPLLSDIIMIILWK